MLMELAKQLSEKHGLGSPMVRGKTNKAISIPYPCNCAVELKDIIADIKNTCGEGIIVGTIPSMNPNGNPFNSNIYIFSKRT